jgi:hypothetical protein
MRPAWLPVLALVAGCARPAAVTPSGPGQWEYTVDAPRAHSRVVGVEATFHRARTERLAMSEEAAPHVYDLEVKSEDGAWRRVPKWGSGWLERTCVEHCTVRYHLDLDQVAAGCGDEIDCAMRIDDSTLSPALTWLIHPAPKVDVPVVVRVRAQNEREFATGMHSAGASLTYSFRSSDLDEGSFTAFGPMRKYRVDVPGGGIDVRILGRPMAMSDDTVRAWVGDAGRTVAGLFGRFPVQEATVFFVSVPDSNEVVFGKVLSLAGASVCVIVGQGMPASAVQSDWVLVHELFHLGFPSFRGEGRWLGEGLATYYEPILRARAGVLTDAELWTEFAEQMPRGQPRRGSSAGLIHREDLDSVYWGGAMWALAADVAIREETRGQKSLDDVLRAALARGGDATRVWTVADVVELGDEVTGTHVLRRLYERHAARGERIDLAGLMSNLGVERRGRSVSLREDRPLSGMRKAIATKR